ncbi:MAG: S41 family peptidase [Armatimonadota bacterium]
MNSSSIAELVRLAGEVWLLGPALGDATAAQRWEDALGAALDLALWGNVSGARAHFVAAMRDSVVPIGPKRGAASDVSEQPRFAPGGVPIVALPGPGRVGRRLETRLIEAISSGDAIIDLRRRDRATDACPWVFPEVLTAARPQERFRVHLGWRSEGRLDTGDFGSAWHVLDARGPVPAGRVAFVVDPDGHVPPAALAWAMLGRATWVLACPGEPSVPMGTMLPRGDVGIVVGEFPEAGPVPVRVPIGDDPIGCAADWLRSGASGRRQRHSFPDRPAGVPEASHRDGRVSAIRALLVLAFFHPYRREAFAQSLARFIPECWNPSESARVAAMRRALAVLGDGHARVRTPDPSDPLAGVPPALRLRWTGHEPVVARLLHPTARAYGARVGDRVATVDGEPVASRARRLAALLPAGTPAASRLYVANRLLCGPAGSTARIGFRDSSGRIRRVDLPRDPSVFAAEDPPERDTPTAGWLASGVAYIDLDRIRPADLESVLRRMRGAREWVVDLRGRANEGGWLLARFLAPPSGVSGARFVLDAVAAPQVAAGGRLRRSVEERVEPGAWRFPGRTTVWVDERTQSQSELAALLLRACGARIVGARSAGAIGDVTEVAVSPSAVLAFSGQRIEGVDGTVIHAKGLSASPGANTDALLRAMRPLPL